MEETSNINPCFSVWLADLTKHQSAIRQCELNDFLKFRINVHGVIEVYSIKHGVIGTILKKDAVLFPIIYDKPNYFEGQIIAIAKSSKSSLKVRVNLQIKTEYSFRLFKENNNALFTYINLESMVKANDTIMCNYGKVVVLEVFNNHLLVDVPNLGKREIYDLKNIERYHR